MSRNIDEMTLEEIKKYVSHRKQSLNFTEVCFYIDAKVHAQYRKMRKDLAKEIPVPNVSQEKPSKYVFNAESMVTQKLCCCFENGKPSCVTFDGVNIGQFTLQPTSKDNFSYRTESKDYGKFWALLEENPNLKVEVDESYSNVGGYYHFKVKAEKMIGDFSWFY